MARLKRIQPPPQFTLGFTELEWQGYEASCIRVQQGPNGPESKHSKKGPDAKHQGR
jgi:hypothetical protein